MRKTSIQNIKTVVTEDIICNKCEASLKDKFDGFNNYEGLVEASFIGGYYSKIGDSLECQFSLCEDCLIELFKTFKIEPYKNQHIIMVG